MTPECYDSEVMSLIQDLGLVRIGSPEYRSFLAALVTSRYTNYWFCERVNNLAVENERKRKILMRVLYKRNRKFSRYVCASYTDK